MEKLRHPLLAVGVVLGSLLAFAGTAAAQTTTLPPVPDASGVAGAAGAGVGTGLYDTFVTVLPYAAVIVAVFLGWRIAKRVFS